MSEKEFNEAIEYLATKGIALTVTRIWDDKPFSVELQTNTDAGEDMIIYLEEPSKECLQGYIDGFDIEDEVDKWWNNGVPGPGVPFQTKEEHRADYRAFLSRLKDIVADWPDGSKKIRASFDVSFLPVVNVWASVGDPKNLTATERDEIIRRAVDAVRDQFAEKISTENFEDIRLWSVKDERGIEYEQDCEITYP